MGNKKLIVKRKENDNISFRNYSLKKKLIKFKGKHIPHYVNYNITEHFANTDLGPKRKRLEDKPRATKEFNKD